MRAPATGRWTTSVRRVGLTGRDGSDPPSGAGRPPGSAVPFNLVLVLGALSALGPLANDTYLPALPSLTRDLHSSTAAAQLTLTTCFVGLALGQLLVGPLSDRKGRRVSLLAGVATFTAASAACAVVSDVWVLVALRLVEGGAAAAAIVVVRTVVRDLTSGAAAARLFSLLMLVNGLVPILAPLAGGQLLHVTDWRGIFGALAAAGALLWCIGVVALRETHPPELRRTSRGLAATLLTYGRLLADRRFLGYTLTQGLSMGAMFAYIAGSPFVLQNVFHLSPQLFSVAFASNAFGILAASQVSGHLVRRVHPARIFTAGALSCAAGGTGLLAAAVAHAGVFALLVPLFVTVASMGLILPNGAALALQDHPQESGSASALVGSAQFLIGAAVAPLVGIAGPRTALPMAVVICVLGAGSAAAVLLTRTTERLRVAPAALPETATPPP